MEVRLKAGAAHLNVAQQAISMAPSPSQTTKEKEIEQSLT